jgi:AraC-like DNA-binding protein
MKHIGLTRSKHLLPVARLLQRAGSHVEPLLGNVKLPVACLANPDLLVPTFRIREFRELAAFQIGAPNIVLPATEKLEIANLGEFGQAILKTPTLFRSLAVFRDLVNTESSSVAVKLWQADGCVWFSHHQRETKSDQWNSELYMLIWMLKTVRLSAPDWSPDHLFVNSKESSGRRAATDSLVCQRVTFGAKHTLFAIPESILANPVLPGAREGIHVVDRKNLVATAPATTFVESLCQALDSYGQNPWSSIHEVAEISGLSIRTLQRRLNEGGLTYSKFAKSRRFDAAISLLANTDTALPDISDQLGYSTHTNFSRAFHRWAGLSPSEFRRHRRGRI